MINNIIIVNKRKIFNIYYIKILLNIKKLIIKKKEKKKNALSKKIIL